MDGFTLGFSSGGVAAAIDNDETSQTERFIEFKAHEITLLPDGSKAVDNT